MALSSLLDVLAHRVLVTDGAMGTMLQTVELGLDDFAGLEGCNEILNVTRPDVVRAVHRGYLEAGAAAVESNTVGANLATWPNTASPIGSGSWPRRAPRWPARWPARWSSADPGLRGE